MGEMEYFVNVNSWPKVEGICNFNHSPEITPSV